MSAAGVRAVRARRSAGRRHLGAAAAVAGVVLAVGSGSARAAERALRDRPDELVGAQVHLLYVVPSDAADRQLDVNGTIAQSFALAQGWLRGQAAGRGLRVDTFSGAPDITFARLASSDQQMAAQGPYVRDEIERQLTTAGLLTPGKVYLGYYDGTSSFACGGGAWPPVLPGVLAALYLRGAPAGFSRCDNNALPGVGGLPGYWEYSAAHELLHTLGFVASCAPHHTRAGHVSHSPADLMYAGDAPWTPQQLDVGHDDYFGHGRADCPDLARSDFLESNPGAAPTASPSPTATPALAAPAAATRWSAPVTVSSSSTFLVNPFFGFGDGGRGLAAWAYRNGVGAGARSGWRAAPRGPGGRFGAEREIPRLAAPPVVYGRDRVVGVSQPVTVVAGHGRARVRVAFGSTSGRFGRARTIDRIEPAFGPALAANDRGHVAVAYLQRPSGGPRAVTLAERRPGGGFGRPRIVARRGGPTAVAVAVGARGDLVIAWVQAGGVMARVRRAGGRLGPVVRLGPGAVQSSRLRAAVSARGAVWVAWASQLRTEGGDAGPFELRRAVRPAGARAFGRARLLERHDQLANQDADIDLALDPGGAGFVAWSGWDGARLRARLAAIDARGRSAAIRTLSQPGYGAVVHDVATSRRRGEALVVWARLDAVGELGTQVLAGLVEPGGAYAGEEAVSDADRARLPVAAFDPASGAPTVVWSQRIGPDGPAVPIEQVRTVLRAATRLP